MSTLNLSTNHDIEHEDLALVDPKLLPPQIRIFIQTVGLPDTIIFLKEKGGTVFRFPFEAKGTKLERIVGRDSAYKLCQVFGGKTIDLPKADKILMQIRNIAINNERSHPDLDKRLSLSQAALKFNLTTRQIKNISHNNNENTTGDLFD